MSSRTFRLQSVLALSAALLAAASGCGTKDPLNASTIDAYSVLSGSPTQATNSLSGTGAVVFSSPMSGVSTERSFALAFTLSDGGSLTLSAYSGSNLAGGIDYVFTRSGSTLTATAGGVSIANSVDASGAITLQIDVHNSENLPGAHSLVWTGTSFDEADAIFDSESPLVNIGNGTGAYWGLTLSNATVARAQQGEPKFEE